MGGTFQVQVNRWNGGLIAYNGWGAKGYLLKSDWAQPEPKDDRKKEGRFRGVRVGGTYRLGFVLESGRAELDGPPHARRQARRLD